MADYETRDVVFARLKREGLQPSPEADPHTLIRRVSLDLVGLPPTPEEADAFARDKDPRAYEKLVDRLLESPRYGEHGARRWLDLARYADTNGYEKDRQRSIWPWRDWVIRALNDDMPFDQFTIEQLAGDLLPGATPDQRIATGFHRNTMLNEEGGIDPLEYRFYAMVDRVATTGTVWMGLTLGCARCHAHKYDPIPHADFYRMMALLDNADEPDMVVSNPSVEKRRREILDQIAVKEAELAGKFPKTKEHLDRRFGEWLKKRQADAVEWTVLRPHALKSNLPKLQVLEDGSILSSGDITKRDLFTLRFNLDDLAGPVRSLRLEVLPDERLPAGGPGRAFYEGRKGDFFLSEITATQNGKPVRFASAWHSYGKISIGSGKARAENVLDGIGSTGWSTSGREGKENRLVLHLEKPLAPAGELVFTMLFERHFSASLGRFRLSASPGKGTATMDAELEVLVVKEPGRDRVLAEFLSQAPELADARKKIEALRKKLPKFTTTLVMKERPADNPRKTYRRHRGEYLSPKELVTPGVPSVLPTIKEGRPANRLELARWLVSDRNPLAGRVLVNREWAAIFGTGIVRTTDDLGIQGEPPSHPALLDWLAVTFVRQGTSLKKLHRLIVTSATYRQASGKNPEQYRRDPSNRLLARGPRMRVSAEEVRDILLKASGKLSTKMYGPGVFSPQPASVTAYAYGSYKWKASAPPDRFRRSIYTYRKRTAPFGAFSTFDGPSGEICTARRDRSNTPLQALTLLNDGMVQELAQALGRSAADLDGRPMDRATYVLRRCVIRRTTRLEASKLLGFYFAQRRRLEAGELDAKKIGDPDPKRAAWIMAARVAMNLDETITKQ